MEIKVSGIKVKHLPRSGIKMTASVQQSFDNVKGLF